MVFRCSVCVCVCGGHANSTLTGWKLFILSFHFIFSFFRIRRSEWADVCVCVCADASVLVLFMSHIRLMLLVHASRMNIYSLFLNHTYLNCISLYTPNKCKYTHSIFNRTLGARMCVCLFTVYLHFATLPLFLCTLKMPHEVKASTSHYAFILFIVLLRNKIHLFIWMCMGLDRVKRPLNVIGWDK